MKGTLDGLFRKHRDDVAQRLWGWSDFPDVVVQQYQNKDLAGSAQYANGRDHHRVHSRFLDAVNDRAANDQRAGQQDDRPHRPWWAGTCLGLEYPRGARLADLIEIRQRV